MRYLQYPADELYRTSRISESTTKQRTNKENYCKNKAISRDATILKLHYLS